MARELASVTVGAPFRIYDGYGSMAEYLVLGMVRAGIAVNVVPFRLDEAGLTPQFREILQRSRPATDDPVLYFSWLGPDLDRFRDARNLFINTMWESSLLPASWPMQLNQARAVIVPTEFVAGICRASGVQVPIVVVPEGVDPAVYHYESRPRRRGLTTLMVGALIERKNAWVGLDAWKLAFAQDPKARLIIKTRLNALDYLPDDPRIRCVKENGTSRGIAHWYRQADVLLALGNEGFGLPLVEAMATGLPVIALASEGQGDVCAAAGDRLLPVPPARCQEYNLDGYGPSGVRGIPAAEDVAARLRWVADHRDQAQAMGREASTWVLKHRNIWNKAPLVLKVMEKCSSGV